MTHRMTVYEATALTVALSRKCNFTRTVTVYQAQFVAKEFERRLLEARGELFFEIADVSA